jgi:hypothetical protein
MCIDDLTGFSQMNRVIGISRGDICRLIFRAIKTITSQLQDFVYESVCFFKRRRGIVDETSLARAPSIVKIALFFSVKRTDVQLSQPRFSCSQFRLGAFAAHLNDSTLILGPKTAPQAPASLTVPDALQHDEEDDQGDHGQNNDLP